MTFLHLPGKIYREGTDTEGYVYGAQLFCIRGQRGGDEGRKMVAHYTHESGLEKFQAVLQNEVPKGREGKHKRIVSTLLKEIEQLAPGMALKVPISTLPDRKENIRAALNRATRQRGLQVATSSDASHLYIWKSADGP